MTKIYARTFAVVPDDVERDRVRVRGARSCLGLNAPSRAADDAFAGRQVLALRLEALQFIRPEHLESPAHHRCAALQPRLAAFC